MEEVGWTVSLCEWQSKNSNPERHMKVTFGRSKPLKIYDNNPNHSPFFSVVCLSAHCAE